MGDAKMKNPALQLLAVVVLIIVIGLVHAAAVLTVGAGYGMAAIVSLFLALPFLRRYLD
jgi:hypothetical protein